MLIRSHACMTLRAYLFSLSSSEAIEDTSEESPTLSFDVSSSNSAETVEASSLEMALCTNVTFGLYDAGNQEIRDMDMFSLMIFHLLALFCFQQGV